MKLSTLFAAVVGAIIAGSGTAYYYNNNSSHSPKVSNPVLLTLNKTEQGEISTNSFFNLSNGVRSAPYLLHATEKQLIKIKVDGALRSQIGVLENNQLIATTAASENQNKLVDANYLAFTTEAGKSYQIVVSGVNSRSYGPFSIEATPLESSAGQTITPDATFTEWALGVEPLRYPLEITEDGIYRIEMRADQGDLDPYLDLTNRLGRTLVSDDDGGSNLNARIQTYLTAGSYAILASSALGAENFKGPFVLEVTKEGTPESINLKSGDILELNAEPKTGLYIGEPQEFTFILEEPTLVSVNLDNDLQAGVKINQFPNRYSQAESTNAVLQPGQHTISVGGPSQSGVFSIALSTSPAPTDLENTILQLNSPINTTLPAYTAYAAYPLTIDEPGNYAIEMTAPSLDTYLYLLKDNRLIAENDDMSSSTDSLIEMFLEPGDYLVYASSYSIESRNSPYTLRASKQD